MAENARRLFPTVIDHNLLQAWAEMHEKKDAEVAENTRRLFSILQTIQNELTESRSDTQMALKMFQDLTFAASRLEKV